MHFIAQRSSNSSSRASKPVARTCARGALSSSLSKKRSSRSSPQLFDSTRTSGGPASPYRILRKADRKRFTPHLKNYSFQFQQHRGSLVALSVPNETPIRYLAIAFALLQRGHQIEIQARKVIYGERCSASHRSAAQSRSNSHGPGLSPVMSPRRSLNLSWLFTTGARRLVRRCHAISPARSHLNITQCICVKLFAVALPIFAAAISTLRSSRHRARAGTSSCTTYQPRWLPLCPRSWLPLLISQHLHRAAFLRRQRRLDHPTHAKQQAK